MKSCIRPVALAGAWAVAVALGGCASAPAHFYTLAVPAEPAEAAALSATPVFVEFAPLGMPQRLARPQMVVRKADSESTAKVEVLEDYRWASSFEYELRDALANRVARRLGAVNSTVAGRSPGQQAWRISLQVLAFDAIQDQRIDVDLGWSVRRTDSSSISACRWSTSEPVGQGMDALAQGAQRVTLRAADAIARHVAALEAGAAPDCMAPASDVAAGK